MGISIVHPGLLTTVQDLGRPGYQKDGLVVGGALDAVALRVANLLVGNLPTAAGLELTLLGPRLRFETDQLVALTGAHLSPTLDGQPVGTGRPLWVRAGTELAFGAPAAGSRAYLAVAGGLDVPLVLGSRATYLRAELGGLHGRRLLADDYLTVAELSTTNNQLLAQLTPASAATRWRAAKWQPEPALRPLPAPEPLVRAIRGPEYGQFSAASQRAFWQEPFVVTPAADRMGYRLQGPALARPGGTELLSSAVTFGTVQVPAGGQAIVLLADRQTTGGYPRIAQVITADFGALAQLRPGQRFRFAEVTLAEAQTLYLAQECRLRALQRAIHLQLLRP